MTNMSRIRLTRDVPVEARHGMKKGTEHDIVQTLAKGIWVQGDRELVKILSGEFEYVEEVTK